MEKTHNNTVIVSNVRTIVADSWPEINESTVLQIYNRPPVRNARNLRTPKYKISTRTARSDRTDGTIAILR